MGPGFTEGSAVPLHLNILSLALLGTMAVAYSRQRGFVLGFCGLLFYPVATLATLAVYWTLSPLLALLVLAFALGLPLLGLLLFGVDRLFAPFCLEMTYATVVCWILWPILVLAGFVGLLFH